MTNPCGCYITVDFATDASQKQFLHNSTKVAYNDFVSRLLSDKG